MIAIIDYGAGNLFSVKNALDFLQKESTITEDVQEIRKADAMILPGVGAFPDAMRMLNEKGLDKVICEEAQRKPLLGICLGMQMLFETSYEFKETKGLGLLEGSVVPIDGGGLKIPHMGWNNLTILNPCKMTEGLKEDAYVYFVHSYYLQAKDPKIVAATAEYGVTIHASVEKENVFACQFHPEKSSKTGLAILKNFLAQRRKG